MDKLGSADDLPGLTKMVIAASNAFTHNFPYVFVAVIWFIPDRRIERRLAKG